MSRPNAALQMTMRQDAHGLSPPLPIVETTLSLAPSGTASVREYRSEDTSNTRSSRQTRPPGLDNTTDARPAIEQSSLPIRGLTHDSSPSEVRQPSRPQTLSDENNLLEDFDFKVPTSSIGLTTFGYQRALKTRVNHDKLLQNGALDTHLYTPTFVHDILMLPGSLAQLIGKESENDIIDRLTPALLPCFRAHVHPDSGQPRLLPSSTDSDRVQGMLLFGQGRRQRDLVHQHYRPHARRAKVEVVVEVLVPDPLQPSAMQRWRPRRRKLWANAWIGARDAAGQDGFGGMTVSWRLEEFLAGAHEKHQPLEIVVDQAARMGSANLGHRGDLDEIGDGPCDEGPHVQDKSCC